VWCGSGVGRWYREEKNLRAGRKDSHMHEKGKRSLKDHSTKWGGGGGVSSLYREEKTLLLRRRKLIGEGGGCVVRRLKGGGGGKGYAGW